MVGAQVKRRAFSLGPPDPGTGCPDWAPELGEGTGHSVTPCAKPPGSPWTPRPGLHGQASTDCLAWPQGASAVACCLLPALPSLPLSQPAQLTGGLQDNLIQAGSRSRPHQQQRGHKSRPQRTAVVFPWKPSSAGGGGGGGGTTPSARARSPSLTALGPPSGLDEALNLPSASPSTVG